MKNDLTPLKPRHSIFLVMIVILSPHLMVVAQERGRRNEKALSQPLTGVIAAPDKLKTSAVQPAAAGCELSPQRNPAPHEGPTDYDQYVRPEGKVESVMFFVEFPDAPQSA